MATKRRKRCSDCGELGATLTNRDAGNHVHWFHPECWAALRDWLCGKSTPKQYPSKGAEKNR